MLHPCPLSDAYYLVASQPTSKSAWGLYLVDIFDNFLLLKEEPGAVLFEPVALRKRPAPPIIPSRVNPAEKWATLFMSDVYSGPGLEGVPRGTVKRLRLFTYQFAYHGMGGQVNRVGLDGPWDIKRVLGTAPVEPDGSAFFRVPANTPISIQPLDATGRALARMRSWTTAMPGERQSCGGCHERQNTVPQARSPMAALKAPADIEPWYGPTRGFSFNREVQPVLDRYCVSCHNGDPQAPPDLTLRPPNEDGVYDATYRRGSLFPPAYRELRAFVRSGPAESDMHLLPPAEFHASTTELAQLLERGHYGVRLDAESCDRLNTWIDIGAPAHGTWREIVGPDAVERQRQRRLAMLVKYANLDDDAEVVHSDLVRNVKTPAPIVKPPACETAPQVPEWPFDAAEATRRQSASGPITRGFDLGNGVRLQMVRVPSGAFLMGNGQQQPFRRARIQRPFLMGQYEVSNEQYARFDPRHDSRLEHADFLHFSSDQRGYPLNEPRQPVCRVSWNQARAFCQWLSARTGARFDLPTEEQWEYACRAGTATPLWYGTTEAAFNRYANLADTSFRKTKPAYQDALGRPLIVPEWRPAVTAVNDGFRVSSPIGSFQPNPWGLYDMHGNVWEWTRDIYSDTQTTEESERRTIRGGAWSDRPKLATSATRWGYPPWQVIYNVGFRVVCEE
jgi:formylglycine-generating enzyme required for sulfatase activity